MDLTSDTIAINFLIMSYLDWKRKGEPVGNSTKNRQFIKNSKILFDNLICEYITRQWRGSSDSRIAENIKNFSSRGDLYNLLPKNRWIDLINEMIDKHSIQDYSLKTDGKDTLIKPILFYYYILKSQSCPDGSNITIELDHIIPQSLLKQSTINDKETIIHNIFNIALLPKRDNISKSDSRLIEISNTWLIDQIIKYTEINQSEFKKYSDVSNITDLKEFRRKKFETVFDNNRTSIFEN